ncbi:MAG: septal ring lytic transglycosylase RlpA family protein [Ghiorsea sp.]
MQTHAFVLLIAGLSILLSACAPTRYPPNYHGAKEPGSMLGHGGTIKRGNPYKIDGKMYYPLESAAGYNETGIGSWYGKKFHGNKTANGERYDMYAMTAAHTTLPMPSMVLVTNLENGKSVKVRVNDRGPFVKSRLIDLSYSAARALGYAEKGTTRVRVQSLDVPKQVEAVSTIPVVEVTPLIKPVALVPVVVSQPIEALSNEVPTKEEVQQPLVKQAFIQVGAFSEKVRADSVVSDLQAHLKAEHPVLKVEAATHVYRVRMGPFDLDVDAETALEHLKARGYDAAMIIHD